MLAPHGEGSASLLFLLLGVRSRCLLLLLLLGVGSAILLFLLLRDDDKGDGVQAGGSLQLQAAADAGRLRPVR